ncbi:hypothetical protein C8039_06130 [Halogeometricum sp. wsp3]|nr:hypothetical protein C8039_06130 [Halogeometricum sp. wsp3]
MDTAVMHCPVTIIENRPAMRLRRLAFEAVATSHVNSPAMKTWRHVRQQDAVAHLVNSPPADQPA